MHPSKFILEDTDMTPSFDAASLLDSARTAFAPVLRVQQEGVKTLETLARHQFAVAGDYLNWSMAQARAAVAASSPTELFTRQAELNGQFGEQLRSRAEELVKLAGEVQGAIQQFVSDATANATEATAQASAATGSQKKTA